MRRFTKNKIEVGDRSIIMECIQNRWGADDQVVDLVLGGKFQERLSLDAWCSMASTAETGDVFLDVGAYSGIYALAAAAFSKSLRVVAFEPSTITFGRLAQNVLLNSFDRTILPVNLAAGEARHATVFPHRFGIYSLCSGENDATTSPDHTQPTCVIPLDTLAANNNDPYLNSKAFSLWPYRRVRAMKIDVEGAEQRVLDGAHGLIANHRPVIIAEVLNADANEKMAAFASSAGYEMARVPNELNVILTPKGQKSPLVASTSQARSVSGKEISTFST